MRASSRSAPCARWLCGAEGGLFQQRALQQALRRERIARASAVGILPCSARTHHGGGAARRQPQARSAVVEALTRTAQASARNINRWGEWAAVRSPGVSVVSPPLLFCAPVCRRAAPRNRSSIRPDTRRVSRSAQRRIACGAQKAEKRISIALSPRALRNEVTPPCFFSFRRRPGRTCSLKALVPTIQNKGVAPSNAVPDRRENCAATQIEKHPRHSANNDV